MLRFLERISVSVTQLNMSDQVGRGPSSGVPETAIGDLFAAAKAWRLWTLLAWHDLKRQFGRAYLGMFWIPCFTGLFVAAFTLVFSRLNGVPASEFAVYVASGFILWTFMQEVMIEGSGVFQSNQALIKDSICPRSLPVFRSVQSSSIRLIFNMSVLAGVYLVFGLPEGFDLFGVLLGLVVVILTAVPTALVCSVLGVCFADVRLIISVGMRVMFFLTPIMWKPERLGNYAQYVVYNPFFHFIELVRAPAEGRSVPLLSMGVVFACFLIVSVCGLGLFVALRRRLVFWL